jgi:hypothetical protein
MIYFIKPTIFLLTLCQLCSLGRAQQDYRIDEVTEWNLQTVTVRKEINEATEDAKAGLNYREKRITVRKPVTEDLVRVEQNIVYKPVLIPNAVPPITPVPTPRLGIPQRRLQWTPGGYRVDPISGQTTFQRGALRWNTNATNSLAYQNAQPNMPAYTYQPEVVETRTPVTVTRYVDEVVTQRIPLERKVTNETTEKLVAVRVRYKTPINSVGEVIGPTERIVVPDDDSPMDTVPALNSVTDEVTFRADKEIEGATKKSNISVLKPITPSSTPEGFTGVLKPITKPEPSVTSETVESNFKEITPVNAKFSEQIIETSSQPIIENETVAPALGSSMKSIWNK